MTLSKVLLDTNFLLIPGKFRVDIFSELKNMGNPKLFTIDLVVSELKGLSSGKGADAANARLGLELLGKNDVIIIETSGNDADSEIAKIAIEAGYAVCTQDAELQGVLRAKGAKVVILRQKRMLEET